MLVDHMKSGMSFEAFAGHPDVMVNRDTLYQWVKDHQDFSDAKKSGSEAARFFLEATGIKGLHGKIPNFNSTVWIFTMKNRCQWRDKVEHSGAIDTTASADKLKRIMEDPKLAAAAMLLAEAEAQEEKREDAEPIEADEPETPF
ncbi:MAG: hypothetical protein HC888_07765 [Candidatus Competibacteraceae bacterium]|nr:hypothetical protein [Candidatus Competibacteraceae bacterium]